MNVHPRFGNLRFLPFLFLALVTAVPETMPAQQSTRIGVLGMENLNRDPRYDYLEGMIIGVLMYDLIRADGIELVERARMDRVLDEQNMRLLGLLTDQDTAVQVGQLAGADALLEGSYAFLGREIIINLSLMTVNDGKTTPFTTRGFTENTIHDLAAALVEKLTGTPVIFSGTEGERSLLSLSDEEPGSIEFYCNFIRGEIYVDEEFYGYTPGGTTPTVLEDLTPGKHIIRVEAGNDFGEIEWPQIVFKDWQRTVDVTAGRKSVVRATISHFNEQIYNAINIFRENWRLESGVNESIDFKQDISYQERSGRRVPVELRMKAAIDGRIATIRVEISVDGEEYAWDIDRDSNEVDFQEKAGPLLFDFEKDWYSNSYWDLDIWVRRTDIHQGLHREEM